LIWHASDFKEFTVRLEEAEDCEGRAGVAPAADAPVIPQFGKRFASDHLRDNYRSPEPSLSPYGVDRPTMVAITAIQGCNQKPGVRERAQR
jgi:hypothetical protein